MQYVAVVYSHKRIKPDELYKYDINENLLKKYGCEYVIIRTCNRIEFYLADKNSKEEIPSIIKEAANNVAEVYTGKEAVNHLFSVASGLESMLIGKNEILGQVKESYQHYKNLGKPGKAFQSSSNLP